MIRLLYILIILYCRMLPQKALTGPRREGLRLAGDPVCSEVSHPNALQLMFIKIIMYFSV